jgi:2C-methyl-D-erythritol 2,4-cyclodiphosphate synthase
MNYAQRVYAREFLALWEGKNGKLTSALRREFLESAVTESIITYNWKLIRVAVQVKGHKKLQRILEYAEQNKWKTSEQLDKEIGRRNVVRSRQEGLGLAA